MTTLIKILESRNQIETLANQFGFKPDIRIYHPMESDILNFLVIQDPNKEISFKNLQYFKVKLVELTNCEVELLDYNALDNLYKENCLNNSAKLENDALRKLFDRSIEEIAFKKHENFDNLFLLVLKQANDFLLKNDSQKNSSNVVLSTNPSALFKPENKDSQEKKVNFNVQNNNLIITIPLPENFQISNSSSVEEFFENLANDCKEKIDSANTVSTKSVKQN